MLVKYCRADRSRKSLNAELRWWSWGAKFSLASNFVWCSKTVSNFLLVSVNFSTKISFNSSFNLFSDCFSLSLNLSRSISKRREGSAGEFQPRFFRFCEKQEKKKKRRVVDEKRIPSNPSRNPNPNPNPNPPFFLGSPPSSSFLL